MSPARKNDLIRGLSFPRVSGDEPVREQPAKDGPKFSPRERG